MKKSIGFGYGGVERMSLGMARSGVKTMPKFKSVIRKK